jgi:DnaK suppressor protein
LLTGSDKKAFSLVPNNGILTIDVLRSAAVPCFYGNSAIICVNCWREFEPPSSSSCLFINSKAFIQRQYIGISLNLQVITMQGEIMSTATKTYIPSEKEVFMSERQQQYFREKLIDWKNEIIRESKETLISLQLENINHADLADRATSESERSIELRARDRQRKLIAKIDAALARISEGAYGYCEDTDEPIGLNRLIARPIATLSIEAQERHERREKVYRDD